MKILGLSGKAGVGKTLLADYLVDNLGYEKVSIASSLKDLAKLIFNFTDIDFSSTRKKEANWRGHEWSPREFLVHLGEFLRYHDDNYLLNKATSKLIHPEKKYVLDDVRYPNEADCIQQLGGHIVRINRYEKNNPYGKNKDILSETSLDNYDFRGLVIDEQHNTTKDELYKQGHKIDRNLFGV